MKTSFTLLFLILHSVTFGQSAKKLNRQLRAQFLIEQQKQDSAFAFFTQTKREFDSLKRVTNERMDLLSNEERVALKSIMRTTELISQLKALGIDPNTLIPNNPERAEFIQYREFIRPVREILKTDVKFEQVSNRLYLDGLKRKEQNKLLAEKVKEYKDHSKYNSIRQVDLETKQKELIAFFPKFDSLSRYYNGLRAEFRITGAKLQSKLDALRTEYMKKGPDGFPEGYKKVFYDAFPPPASETKSEALRDIHSELVYDEVVSKDPEPEIYEHVDEPAEFPGGISKMMTYLAENTKCPEIAAELGISPKHFVCFVVSEQGVISNVQLRNETPQCPECDAEIIRVVKSMPNWIPAKKNGKMVSSRFCFPYRVCFK